jgi:hypothetical protein
MRVKETGPCCLRDRGGLAQARTRAEMYMPKRVIVDINLSAVAANLSKEERRHVSELEVRQWLHDAGFRPHGKRWIVNELDLGHLDPTEVRSLEDAPETEAGGGGDAGGEGEKEGDEH